MLGMINDTKCHKGERKVKKQRYINDVQQKNNICITHNSHNIYQNRNIHNNNNNLKYKQKSIEKYQHKSKGRNET